MTLPIPDSLLFIQLFKFLIFELNLDTKIPYNILG